MPERARFNFTDVSEIHSRLFDHRPVLQGHIRAFAREFEEKRGNREQERLAKTQTLVTEMQEKYLTETEKALDTFLPNIHGKLKVAIEVCKKIEEKENNVEVGFLDLKRERRRETWDAFMQQQFDRSAKVGFLDLQRERRRETWDAFMQQQFDRSAKVDQDMDEEMQKISMEYAELEKNLDRIAATQQQ